MPVTRRKLRVYNSQHFSDEVTLATIPKHETESANLHLVTTMSVYLRRARGAPRSLTQTKGMHMIMLAHSN